MRHRWRTAMLPDAKRRTLEELSEDLELGTGDDAAKRSAFWTMLLLSATIASCGVLADSTATVIGAMIIAPLSTPIMGMALAALKRQRNGSFRFVLLGSLTVVLMGAAFSSVLPDSYDLLANSQIQGRVRPSLLDLIAALATGLAGAVALARRDVAAVLPGVAIAISLVPPLVVVGVCAGQGALVLASGALLLFMSNWVALVLAGLFVFAVLGYDAEAARSGDLSPRRTYVTLTLVLAAVLVPLAANSVLTYLVSTWEVTADRLAADWVEDVPDATVERVELIGTTFEVQVRSTVPVPRPAALLRELDGRVPDGLGLRIVTTLGSVTDVGVVGE